MENRSTQLLKGALKMCLLALLRERPCYGYEIVQHLARYGLDLVSEGSIYPLLSRMLTRRYIEGYLVSSTEGPSRKYYRSCQRERNSWSNGKRNGKSSLARLSAF